MTGQSQPGDQPINPYSERTSPAPAPGRHVVVRPAGVTVVAVLACVLGAMGLMLGGWTLVNSFLGPRIAQAFTLPGPYQQAQLDMNARMQQLTVKYRVVNVATSLGSVIVGTALCIGGVGAIRGRPAARTLLARAFLAAMIFECLKLIPLTMWQFEMLPIMQQYMERIATNPSGQNAAQPAMAAIFAKAMLLVGFTIAVGWAVIKLACFGFGARYLSRPAVVAFFEGDSRGG